MRSLDHILKKNEFNIKDLAYIIDRETQTVRMWEKKGFIDGADMRATNNWRVYSAKKLVQVLEQILNRDWKRQVIKNVQEVKYCIEKLKNKQ